MLVLRAKTFVLSQRLKESFPSSDSSIASRKGNNELRLRVGRDGEHGRDKKRGGRRGGSETEETLIGLVVGVEAWRKVQRLK